jgi:hypothetical protein
VNEILIMYQALVMTIAFQICSEIEIRDIDDRTISFKFKREEGLNEFIESVEIYSDYISVSKFNNEVIVSFISD